MIKTASERARNSIQIKVPAARRGRDGPMERTFRMNTRLKKLVQELGDSINSSLSGSEQVAQVVARIKEEGFDIFLVLEATVGLRPLEDEHPSDTLEVVSSPSRRSADPAFNVNASDLRFLKSLRITIDDAA